jgi:hypothetical protein
MVLESALGLESDWTGLRFRLDSKGLGLVTLGLGLGLVKVKRASPF